MRPSKKALYENAICLILLVVAPALAALSGAWFGQIPADTRNILFTPPWDEARPAGLEPSLDIHANETSNTFYPWYRFISENASSGHALLWNPLEGAGTPFMAQWRTRVFSPFTIPFHLFPMELALRLSVMLKLIVAGWCAYYTARRFGLSPSLGLFVGVACQFCGPVYLWPLHPMADALPWFPLLLLGAERFLLGQIRTWPLMAIAIALMAFGGDPETLIAAIVFVALYLLIRRLRNREWAHFGLDFAALSISLCVGLALIAVQLFPYVELMPRGAPGHETPNTALRITDLAAVFLPQLINPDRTDSLSVLRLLHIGVLPVLLLALWGALRGFAEKQLRRGVEAMLITSILFLLIPLALSGLFKYMPGFCQLRPQHFLIAHGFVFTFLAAAAAEEWNTLNPEQCKAAFLRLLVFIPAIWGLLFGGVLVGALKQEVVPAGFWPGYLAAAFAGIALLVLLGITLLRPSARWMGYCLAAITALTLWGAFHSAVPAMPAAQVFPETSFISSLKGMQTRIAGSEHLQSWPIAGNGIPQIYNPSGFTLRRYQNFLERAAKEPLLFRRTGAQGLLLTKSDIQGIYATIRPMLHIQEVFPSGAVLFKDLDTRPRARMIYAGRQANDFDPAQLNPALPPLLEGALLPENDNGPEAAANIVAPESPTRITVKIEQTRPGVLVLADMWYPGWYATVDGKRANVFPVDGVFRGVEVGEGTHEVVFRFDPTWFRLGTYVSIAAAIFILIGLRNAFKPNHS